MFFILNCEYHSTPCEKGKLMQKVNFVKGPNEVSSLTIGTNFLKSLLLNLRLTLCCSWPLV